MVRNYAVSFYKFSKNMPSIFIKLLGQGFAPDDTLFSLFLINYEDHAGFPINGYLVICRIDWKIIINVIT